MTGRIFVGMPWTYIVECADSSFYVGSTWNLERRVAEHNAGVGASYTRRRRPVSLVWAAEFQRVRDAYMFEKQVQNWGRAKRIALIEGRLAELPDLASRSWSARKDRGSLKPGEPGGPPEVS